MNIDCIDYSFIDQNLAQIICDRLEMIFISLFKFRNVRKFDDNVFFYFIIYALYFILIVQNHIEFITFMLITSFDQHQIILNKFWMNNHEVMLNMQFDRLWFKLNVCDHYDSFFIEFVFFSTRYASLFYASTIWFFSISVVRSFFIFDRRAIAFKKSNDAESEIFEKNNDFATLFHIQQIDNSFESKSKFCKFIFFNQIFN